MIESIGILAAMFELIALFLLGRRDALGFVTGMFGNVMWLVYVAMAGSTYGLVLVCTVAFVLNVKGFINWRKI